MNNKFHFEPFSEGGGKPVDIGIDFGNNALKVSYRIANGQITNFTPSEDILNSYNRKSTVFISFDLNKEKIKLLIKEEAYPAGDRKIMELDPSDLDVFFDFAENFQRPNQIFRCIKSQFYEGVLNERSEFFNKVAKRDEYRYFVLGKFEGVTLFINTNLFFDKMYVLCVETVLKDLAKKLDQTEVFCEDNSESPCNLFIRVFSSIPLGATPQLLNDDERVENYLNRKLSKLVFEKILDMIFGESNLVFVRGATDAESYVPSINSLRVIPVFAEIRFKTTYELVTPLINVLENNKEERLLLVLKDIGSLTNQTMFVYVDKAKKIIKPFNLDSFYGGGMSLNEKIIKRYCELLELNPVEYFWENNEKCFKNLQTLEDIKRQKLWNKRVQVKEFYGKDSKTHKIDFKTLNSLIGSYYPRSIEYKIQNYVRNELGRFVEHLGGNVRVILMGESFNQRSDVFNGVQIFLKSLGLGFLEKEPWNVYHTKDVNYISNTMVRSLDYHVGYYTLYDNIAVIGQYNKKEFVTLSSSKVGTNTQFIFNPLKHGNAECILFFTYVRYKKNKLKFDDMSKSVYGELEGHLNTKFMFTGNMEEQKGEIELLEQTKPYSFKNPKHPYYMLPLFKIILHRDNKEKPVDVVLNFVNTFEIYIEVKELGSMGNDLLYKGVMKYPLMLSKYESELIQYDYFNRVGLEFETKMFSSFSDKNDKIEEIFDPKCFSFIFPKSRVQDLDDEDVEMVESDEQVKITEVSKKKKKKTKKKTKKKKKKTKKKKKKKKKGKKRKRDNDDDDDEYDADEDKPPKKKRKKPCCKTCKKLMKDHPKICPLLNKKEDREKDNDSPNTPVQDEEFIFDEEEEYIESEESMDLVDGREVMEKLIQENKEREEDLEKDKMKLSDDGDYEINDENDLKPDTPDPDEDFRIETPSIEVHTDYLGAPPPPPQLFIPPIATKSVQNDIATRILQRTNGSGQFLMGVGGYGGKGLIPFVDDEEEDEEDNMDVDEEE